LRADYHAFLKQFPNGSLAARARERMNALGDPVWNELKKSNDPFKYRDYIKSNPNSPFIDQAKTRFEVLAVAAVQWEKVKAIGDLRQTMRFISENSSSPFAEEARSLIESELWEKSSASGADDLLEFYARQYASTEKGKEAVSKLQTRNAAKRQVELQALRPRIAALNGVKATLHHGGGYAPTELWHENKVIDVCTFETTKFSMETSNPLMYNSESYRIDLNKVRSIYPGPATSWGTTVLVSTSATQYSSPSDLKFSGSGQNFSRKSVNKPFAPFMIPYAVSETYAAVMTTPDRNAATRIADDLNKLAALCKASR
jgi:hypothetical protein